MKYDLSTMGVKALMQTPIRATLSFLDFPHIRLQQETDNNGKVFYIGVLVMDEGDQIIIEMAGANYFKEALSIIAYQQQSTKTPLLIDDELEKSVRYFYEHSQYGDGVNPFIEHRTGTEITIPMMSKANREKVDYVFMQQRIKTARE